MTQLFGLSLGVLAVWRVTHLLNAENGPWNLFGRMRSLVHSQFWAGLFGCFYCLSLWVSVAFTLLLASGWRERALLWPALSAGAILLERFSSRESGVAPAIYYEEQESDDVRVRKDEDDLPASIQFSGKWNGREQ